MKKQALMKSFLILLPVLSVALATTTDSVMVFEPATGMTQYSSYFAPLNVGALQMITPLAAILSLASGILAAVYLAAKKEWALQAVGMTAFAAAILAVLPILLRGEVMVVPNVGLPLMMLVEYALAFYMRKAASKLTEGKNAPRLKKR